MLYSDLYYYNVRQTLSLKTLFSVRAPHRSEFCFIQHCFCFFFYRNCHDRLYQSPMKHLCHCLHAWMNVSTILQQMYVFLLLLDIHTSSTFFSYFSILKIAFYYFILPPTCFLPHRLNI